MVKDIRRMYNMHLETTQIRWNKSPNMLPEYSTKNSAGMDLRADFSRIKLENTKPLGLFFDADSVCIIDNKMWTLEIKPGVEHLFQQDCI